MTSQDTTPNISPQEEINDSAESLLPDDKPLIPSLCEESAVAETAAEDVFSTNDLFQQGNDDTGGDYKLCGYLFMVSSVGRAIPGIKGRRNSVRKRWFVYSHKTCKLYYYKNNSGTEPLGTIDILLATFLYDPESTSQGQFTIQ
ncbi:unnamed protein product [Meganyctiphanes norvegica]|uniref:PH domain-containing protein n=1 Tax=Meganyctiphanes norvegica TaxID=48144 RepID=A0AAV2SR61_MEGNR